MIPTDVRREQDGQALQVILATQYLLCHGQLATERADTLRLLRVIKAQSNQEPQQERRKLRGERN